jgi:C-8 sterol isomerase
MAPNSSQSGMGGLLKFLAILVGIFTPLVYVLERNLESFYIFQPDHLHDLAKRGIAAHGNDTRAVVKYIVDELGVQVGTKSHINHDEEWIFNNAGGAMGAMYIIHASTPPKPATEAQSLCD